MKRANLAVEIATPILMGLGVLLHTSDRLSGPWGLVLMAIAALVWVWHGVTVARGGHGVGAAGSSEPRIITMADELDYADTAELLLAARINEAVEEWDKAQRGTVAAHMAAHVAARLTEAGYGKSGPGA